MSFKMKIDCLNFLFIFPDYKRSNTKTRIHVIIIDTIILLSEDQNRTHNTRTQ
jgi:hypothetical protein